MGEDWSLVQNVSHCQTKYTTGRNLALKLSILIFVAIFDKLNEKSHSEISNPMWSRCVLK